MTGNGSEGEGVKETWRTGVVLMIVWIVVREYTAGRWSEQISIWTKRLYTLVFISVDCIVHVFRVLEIMADHRG